MNSLNGQSFNKKADGNPVKAFKNGTQLSGMKAICEYVQRGEASILRLIRDFGFPASKLLGVWESDKILIDEWRIKYLKDGGV